MRSPLAPVLGGRRRGGGWLLLAARGGRLSAGLAHQRAAASTTRAATRLATFHPAGTVFSEFTRLANDYSAVNLGQGFPTLPVAEFLLDGAVRTMQDPCMMHQYARSEGHPRLVKALATFYGPRLGRRLDGMTEVLTTVGASEAIYSTIHALINPGDEVIIMQPFYDSYPAAIRLAGGIPVTVNLAPTLTPTSPEGSPKAQGTTRSSQDWRLDMAKLRQAITPRTRMLILNNPHNPSGKVFTRAELLELASVAEAHDLLVLADEVYETLTYDPACPMIKFASLPGMYQRTISVGSAGKMFGITGWKVGWLVAPAELTRSIWMVHQFLAFCVATPLQEGVALALEQAEARGYFAAQVDVYRAKRDALARTLDEVALTPWLPAGGYFILANTDALDLPTLAPPLAHPRRDYQVCRYLTVYAGVTAIPPSAFYDAQEGGPAMQEVAERHARFAFCKEDAALHKADGLLRKNLLGRGPERA